MIARLRDESGITLIEVLATAIIVLVALAGLYIGIIYADKQVQRNYHDRVATLHASGELEWQTYYKKNYKVFSLFSNRPVLLDDTLDDGRVLNGFMSVRVIPTSETVAATYIPYDILEISVTWTEPGDKKSRKIVVREDFY
jgi:hypothetical protein